MTLGRGRSGERAHRLRPTTPGRKSLRSLLSLCAAVFVLLLFTPATRCGRPTPGGGRLDLERARDPSRQRRARCSTAAELLAYCAARARGATCTPPTSSRRGFLDPRLERRHAVRPARAGASRPARSSVRRSPPCAAPRRRRGHGRPPVDGLAAAPRDDADARVPPHRRGARGGPARQRRPRSWSRRTSPRAMSARAAGATRRPGRARSRLSWSVVARRDLTHPVVPTLAAAAFGVAYLIAAPETADMAGAHVPHLAVAPGRLRDLERAVVRRPSHGRLLPALPAARRARGHAARRRGGRRRRGLAVRPARPPARADAAPRRARRLAVPRGRHEQRGHRAHAVHARRRARRGRVGVRAALAVGRRRALAAVRVGEPVCGVFLIVAAAAVLAGARPREERRGGGGLATAVALGAPAVAGGLAMALLFPEGGADHFVAAAFWPMLLVCLGGARARRPAPAHRAVGRRRCTSPCWWPRTRSPTRSGRTRCGRA